MLLDCWKREGKIQTFFFEKPPIILRIWIKSRLLSKMRKNAVSIEVANIELRWEFLFFLQTPSWQQQKKHISKKVTRFCIIYVYLKVSSAGLRTKMHSEKKNVCIHITFIRGCDFSFVNIVMIWICRMGQGNACQKFGIRSIRKHELWTLSNSIHISI